MPAAGRKGDTGSGHDGFPPTPATAGSGDVYANGKPALRKGDPFAPHSKPKHPPTDAHFQPDPGACSSTANPLAASATPSTAAVPSQAGPETCLSVDDTFLAVYGFGIDLVSKFPNAAIGAFAAKGGFVPHCRPSLFQLNSAQP